MEQVIWFVTGKGGVGKSSVAAALACHLASKAEGRVLLAELGDASYFGQLFNLPVSHKPTNLKENLDLVLWDGPSCLREFVRHYLRIEKLVNFFFDNRVMRTFIKAAPGLKELALLGKVTSGCRQIGPALPYSAIVVDAFAFGHFEALLRVPMGIAEIIRFGPMGEQCKSIHSVVTNPAQSQFLFVTVPEEMSVEESREFYQKFTKDFSQTARIIFNKILCPPLTLPELRELKGEFSPQQQTGLGDFVNYLEGILIRQQESLEHIKTLGTDCREVEFVFEVEGMERIERMSACLRDFA